MSLKRTAYIDRWRTYSVARTAVAMGRDRGMAPLPCFRKGRADRCRGVMFVA